MEPYFIKCNIRWIIFYILTSNSLLSTSLKDKSVYIIMIILIFVNLTMKFLAISYFGGAKMENELLNAYTMLNKYV